MRRGAGTPEAGGDLDCTRVVDRADVGDGRGAHFTEVEPAWELPGARDGFERLWTPHRMVYLRGADKPPDGEAGPQCPFCRAPALERRGRA